MSNTNAQGLSVNARKLNAITKQIERAEKGWDFSGFSLEELQQIKIDLIAEMSSD